MNTSVKVTYPDNTVKEFDSLEEAALATGLSEQAIKIRCNKCRQGSSNKKDKITCMWINDTTFRSYQAKKSKIKGAGYEAEIVSKLKEIGYDDVKRSASEAKSLDNNKVDIYGDTPCCIQAKCTQTLPNYFTIREKCTDPRPLAIFWKKVADVNEISKGQVAVVDLDFFYELLKLYKEHEN